MTTITVEGADRAIDAGIWLNERCIDYQIDMEQVWTKTKPRYQFQFSNTKDATHFALKWR